MVNCCYASMRTWVQFPAPLKKPGAAVMPAILVLGRRGVLGPAGQSALLGGRAPANSLSVFDSFYASVVYFDLVHPPPHSFLHEISSRWKWSANRFGGRRCRPVMAEGLVWGVLKWVEYRISRVTRVTVSQVSVQHMQVLMVPFAVIPICSLRDSWLLLKILVLKVLDWD